MVERLLLEWFYAHPHGGLAPNEQNHQQHVPDHGLHEGGPGEGGGDENVVPETGRAGGDGDWRQTAREEQVGQISEKDAMARFELHQQPETGRRA
jgi:hypothetical protein